MLHGNSCDLYFRHCSSFHANNTHVCEAESASIFRWTREPTNFSRDYASVPPSLSAVITVGCFLGYTGKGLCGWNGGITGANL
jgi:hypothetical protein